MAIIDFLKEYYFVVLVVCVMLSYLFGYYLGEGLQKAKEEKRLQEEARDLKKQLGVETLKLGLLLVELSKEGSHSFSEEIFRPAVKVANPKNLFTAELYIQQTTKVEIAIEQMKISCSEERFKAITGHL